MKKYACGYEYKTKEDLEIVKLEKEGKTKYYCPDCKKYKYTEKYEYAKKK